MRFIIILGSGIGVGFATTGGSIAHAIPADQKFHERFLEIRNVMSLSVDLLRKSNEGICFPHSASWKGNHLPLSESSSEFFFTRFYLQNNDATSGYGARLAADKARCEILNEFMAGDIIPVVTDAKAFDVEGKELPGFCNSFRLFLEQPYGVNLRFGIDWSDFDLKTAARIVKRTFEIVQKVHSMGFFFKNVNASGLEHFLLRRTSQGILDVQLDPVLVTLTPLNKRFRLDLDKKDDRFIGVRMKPVKRYRVQDEQSYSQYPVAMFAVDNANFLSLIIEKLVQDQAHTSLQEVLKTVLDLPSADKANFESWKHML